MHKQNASDTVNTASVAEDSNTTEACTPELDPLLRRPLRDADSLAPTPHTLPIPANGVVLAHVVSVTDHEVLVRLPDFDHDTPLYKDGVPARTLCTLPEDWAERPCAVLFENGDPTKPLIVGFLLTPENNFFHTPVAVAETTQNEEIFLTNRKLPAEQELNVDGERVVITADTELELRCGESVILLHREGRIEIRGNYITSQATATQRLRGGSIHMN